MSNCGCIYVGDVGDVEPVARLRESHPRARVPHRCGECGREIAVGEQYEVLVTAADERVERHHTCADCQSLRDEFFRDGWWRGQVREHVEEHVRELRGEIASECLARLTPAARWWLIGVIDVIDEVWEDDDEREADDE